MAGRGPGPKPPKLRQRRNKQSTAARLPSPAEAVRAADAPELPARPDGKPWHPDALAVWADVWESPMAGEYVTADVHSLRRLADLYHRRAFADSDNAAVNIDKEIRILGEQYGLSPIARRRLQWEIARGEDAERKRRNPSRAPSPKPGGDPRAALRVV